MNPRKWQLKCRVGRGMFEDEYLVIIDAVDEKGQNIEAAVFIGEKEISVQKSPSKSEVVEGLLAVSPLEPLEISQERVSVVLPNSTLANGNIVLVKTSDLVQTGG